MPKIPRLLPRPILSVLPVLLACGSSRGPGNADPATATLGTLALDSVYQIETTGSPPGDTTLALTAGTPRVLLLDHGPPANVVFAEIRFDTAAFQAPAGSSVQVTVRPRPGKYAVHFLAPADARSKYGNDIAVERALGIGRLQGDSVVFLPTTHPATDNLRATIPAAGTYLTAAPR